MIVVLLQQHRLGVNCKVSWNIQHRKERNRYQDGSSTEAELVWARMALASGRDGVLPDGFQ